MHDSQSSTLAKQFPSPQSRPKSEKLVNLIQHT